MAQRFTVLVALGDWKHVYPFNASMVNQGEIWAADAGSDHLREGARHLRRGVKKA
jgi:hypothetical protein